MALPTRRSDGSDGTEMEAMEAAVPRLRATMFA